MTTGLSALPTRLRDLSPPTGVCPCDLFKLGAPSPPLCLASKIGSSMTLGALLDRRSMGDTTALSSNERERSLAVPCQDRYFSSPRSPRIRAPRARSSIESLGALVVHCALTARTPRRIFDTPRAFASHIAMACSPTLKAATSRELPEFHHQRIGFGGSAARNSNSSPALPTSICFLSARL
jgi:hypothetical protein